MLNDPPVASAPGVTTRLPFQLVEAALLFAPAAPATRLTLRGVPAVRVSATRTCEVVPVCVVKSPPQLESTPADASVPPDITTLARKKSGVVAAAEELGFGTLTAPTRVPPETVMVLPCFGSEFLKPAPLSASPKPLGSTGPSWSVPLATSQEPLKVLEELTGPDSMMTRPGPPTRTVVLASPVPAGVRRMEFPQVRLSVAATVLTLTVPATVAILNPPDFP